MLAEPAFSMQPLTRHLGFTLILLLVFLIAALAAQSWLQRESRRLQVETVAARRAQFAKALENIHQPPEALVVHVPTSSNRPGVPGPPGLELVAEFHCGKNHMTTAP